MIEIEHIHSTSHNYDSDTNRNQPVMNICGLHDELEVLAAGDGRRAVHGDASGRDRSCVWFGATSLNCKLITICPCLALIMLYKYK